MANDDETVNEKGYALDTNYIIVGVKHKESVTRNRCFELQNIAILKNLCRMNPEQISHNTQSLCSSLYSHIFAVPCFIGTV